MNIKYFGHWLCLQLNGTDKDKLLKMMVNGKCVFLSIYGKLVNEIKFYGKPTVDLF